MASLPDFRDQEWLAIHQGQQDFRREITVQEESHPDLNRRSPKTLVWMSCMVVRQMLVDICYPRSFFPLVERMALDGDIARGVGQLITGQ